MRMKLRWRSEGIACRTALKENRNSRGEIKMKKRIWSNFMPTAWLLGAAIQLWLARVSYQNGEQETVGVQIIIAIRFSIHAIRGYARQLLRRNASK